MIRLTPYQPKLRSVPALTADNFLKAHYPVNYPFAMPEEFSWNFLKRDNWSKTRGYDPAEDDRLTFTSTDHYNSLLYRIHDLIKEHGLRLQQLGIPMQPLEETDVLTVNDGVLIDELVKSPALQKNWRMISLVVAEHDLLRKFTIQRTARPLWYLEDFVGRSKPVTALQTKLLYTLFTEARRQGLSLAPHEDVTDRIDTNSGWFLYESGIEPKLRMIEFAKGIASNGYKTPYSTLMANLRSRCHSELLEQTIFAVATNRRFGPMWKWTRIWEWINEPVSRAEAIGLPRLRNVYMASYIYNSLMNTIYRYTKQLRAKFYGTVHDAAHRAQYLPLLRNKMLFETDISGMDGSMTIEHRHVLFKAFTDTAGHSIPDFSLGLLDHSIFLPYLIPDPHNTSDVGGQGIALKGRFGLFSGIKLTSDIDTFMSLWATHHSLLPLTNSIRMLAPKKTSVWGLFQGDDVLLVADDWKRLASLRHHIANTYKLYGFKTELKLGSRFLMRHLIDGNDFPVLARILQQSVSNEKVRDHAVLYQLGLAARTESLDKYMAYNKAIGNKIGTWLTSEILDIIGTLGYVKTRNLKFPFPYPDQAELASVLKMEDINPFSYSGQLMMQKYAAVLQALTEKELKLYQFAQSRLGLSHD